MAKRSKKKKKSKNKLEIFIFDTILNLLNDIEISKYELSQPVYLEP